MFQENEQFDDFHELDMDGRCEKVDGYLFLSLGFTSKQNAWAGPDHWKYRKAKGMLSGIVADGNHSIKLHTSFGIYSSVVKCVICFVGSEDPVTENRSPLTTKKPRIKKLADVDIDFTKALDNEMSDVFAPPKNPKSILLPVNRAPCNTTLPEDCHYQPEDLVKLFLLPNVTVILITYYKWTT